MGEYNKSIVISRTSAIFRPVPILPEDVARARKQRTERQAKNTKKAYDNDWRHFAAWCASRGGDPEASTPEIVAAYLRQLPEDGFSYASIARASAGIMIKLAKYDRGSWLSRPPEVRDALKDLAKLLGTAPRYAKRPLTLALWEPGLEKAYGDGSLRSLRNRAMVAMGYYLAARRSELVAMTFYDLDTSDRQGVTVTVPRSKTDQEGRGYRKFVYRQTEGVCPIVELHCWVTAAGLVKAGRASGHVFRELSSSGTAMEGPPHVEVPNVAVKEVARALRLDPGAYGAHSLRSGFVTDQAAAGVPLEQIAHQTGHRSLEQLRTYIKRLSPSEGNPTEGLARRVHALRKR
jgi:integrase